MSITTEQLEAMVRTLVWEDADEGMCTKWRAAALGGRYELVDLDKDGRLAVNFCWGRPLSFWFIQGEHDQFGPTGPKQFPTLEVAMAAAHADYAARVLAALDMDILAETFRPPPAELSAAHKRIAELDGALRALMELNDNHGPFGGEMYQDRIDRTWDRARATLEPKP